MAHWHRLWILVLLLALWTGACRWRVSASDVAGPVPVWGVHVSGLSTGDFLYSLDLDGSWQADPKNPAYSTDFVAGHLAPQYEREAYHSLLHWPPAPGQTPESVRVDSPTSAEFLYTGRIRQAVVLRSAERGGMWGTDELAPLNAAARKNLRAIEADPMLGSVRGVVLNPNHRRVAGALVRVTWAQPDGPSPPRGPSRTVRTGRDGAFEIPRLDLGPAVIDVRAAGCAVSHPVAMRIGQGKPEPVVVVLAPGIAVSGSVTDGRSNPVAGAVVRARFAPGGLSRWTVPLPPPVFTDVKGLYALASLAPDTYDFVASAEGQADGERHDVALKLDEAPPTVNLTLSDGVSLRGHVAWRQRGQDAGVGEAAVVAEVALPTDSTGPGATALPQRYVVTDAQGNFVLTGLPRDCTVGIGAFRGLAHTLTNTTVAIRADVAPPVVDLRLPDVGPITGRVLLPGGAPAAGALVVPVAGTLPHARFADAASDPDFLGAQFPRATTEADGTFVIPDFPTQGSVVLEAQAVGYAPTRSAPVSAGTGKTVLKLTEGGKITGRVVAQPGGAPLARMRVCLGFLEKDRRFASKVKSVLTDAEGAFTLDHLRPDVYRLEAVGLAAAGKGAARWHFALAPDDVTVTADAPQVVELQARPGGTLRGKVLVRDTGEPVVGAELRLFPNLRGQMYRPVTSFSGCPFGFWTQAKGEFEIPDVAAGPYSLSAAKAGLYRTGNNGLLTVEVGAGEAIDNVALPMVPGGAVRGRVLGPNGQTVAGVPLELRQVHIPAPQSLVISPGGQPLFNPLLPAFVVVDNARSRGDGRFEFPTVTLALSPYVVVTSAGAGPDSAWRGTSAEVPLTTASRTADVMLNLTAAGSISGHVSDDQRQPIAGASLSVMQRMPPPPPGPDRPQAVLTNDSGEYQVQGLDGGMYALTLSGAGLSPEWRDGIDVANGKPTAGVDFTAARGKTVAGRVVDAAGAGQPGWVVSVSAGTPGPDGARPTGISQVPTDADGKFAIANAPTGKACFRLQRSGIVNAGRANHLSFVSGDVAVPDGGTDQPIVLTIAVRSVQGCVVLAVSGKPVAGVDVQARAYPVGGARQGEGTVCAGFGNAAASGKTDEDGTFQIDAVPNGVIEFTLEGKGILTTISSPKELPGKGVADAGKIEVQPAQDFTGRFLVAATRRPYPLVHSDPIRIGNPIGVQMFGSAGSSPDSAQVIPDENGHFSLGNVRPTVTRLVFDAPGYQPVEVNDLKPTSGGVHDLGNLSLSTGCTLVGTLIDRAAGKPLERNRPATALIRQRGMTQAVSLPLSLAGDDGRFEIRAAPGDIESVTLQPQEYSSVALEKISPPDAQGRIDLGRIEVASGGTVLGTVVDDKSKPCAGALVQIAPQPRPAGVTHWRGAFESVWHETQTDGDGKFRIGLLPDGIYQLSASVYGFAPTVLQNVAVTSGGMAVQVRFAVGTGTGPRLAGTLTDMRQQGLAGWVVSADPGGNNAFRASGATTDAAGRFALQPVPDGNLRLRFIYSKNQKDRRMTMVFRSALFELGGAPTTFALPLGHDVTGRLLDTTGRGVPGVSVQVSQSSQRKDSIPGGATARGLTEDACTLENLGIQADALSDESGRFRVGPLAVGTASFTFTGDMLLPKKLDDIAIGTSKEHDLGDLTVRAGGVLVGRFVDKATRAPLALEAVNHEMTCRLVGSDGDMQMVRCKTENNRTTFRLGGVPVGTALVSLTVIGYSPVEIRNPKVAPGQETDVGDVALDAGITVVVRLVSAETGRPLSVAWVNFHVPGDDAPERSQAPVAVTTNPSADVGVHTFRSVPSGLPQITLEPAGCEPIVVAPLPAPNAKGVVDLGDRKVRLLPPSPDPRLAR